MIEDPEAPLVPEIRRREVETRQNQADSESIKEDIDALRMEAPFVPMVPKRRRKRLKAVKVQ